MQICVINTWLAWCFLVCGCASIIDDDNQPISVDTPGCPGASCQLTNSQGVYFVKSTPETIVVNKAFGDLTIVCTKGDKKETLIHVSKANVSVFGNILFGGLPGVLIDAGSGSGYDYPTHLINSLSCP